MAKRIAMVLLFLFLGAQFVRPDFSLPEEDPAKTIEVVLDAPIAIRDILERACRDCHTSRVQWPWYAQVAPVSWLTAKDVKDGRKHLDLSNWADLTDYRAAKKLDEMVEELEEGKMPLRKYVWLHPEAKLTDAERTQLVEWARSEHAAVAQQLEQDEGR